MYYNYNKIPRESYIDIFNKICFNKNLDIEKFNLKQAIKKLNEFNRSYDTKDGYFD